MKKNTDSILISRKKVSFVNPINVNFQVVLPQNSNLGLPKSNYLLIKEDDRVDNCAFSRVPL